MDRCPEVPLKEVPFARTAIEDAPAEDDEREDINLAQDDREGEDYETSDGGHFRLSRDRLRTLTVTDMSYLDGVLLVAGASNEEFASTLRRIPFPFNGGSRANSLEIYHVSHGKYETASPIRDLRAVWRQRERAGEFTPAHRSCTSRSTTSRLGRS